MLTILALTWVLKVRSQSQLKSISTKGQLKLPNYQRVKLAITWLPPTERSPTRSCLHAPPTHPQLTCCHFPPPVPSPTPHHFPIECSQGFRMEFLPLSATSYRAMPQIQVGHSRSLKHFMLPSCDIWNHHHPLTSAGGPASQPAASPNPTLSLPFLPCYSWSPMPCISCPVP